MKVLPFILIKLNILRLKFNLMPPKFHCDQTFWHEYLTNISEANEQQRERVRMKKYQFISTEGWSKSNLEIYVQINNKMCALPECAHMNTTCGKLGVFRHRHRCDGSSSRSLALSLSLSRADWMTMLKIKTMRKYLLSCEHISQLFFARFVPLKLGTY